MTSKASRDSVSASAANNNNDPVIRSMETLLRRTQVLQGALKALMRDLQQTNPLLPYPVMQTRLNHIQSELNECKNVMEEHMDVFANVVILPTPTFPTKFETSTRVLEYLVRSKLDPHVEEWQRQMLKIAADKDNKQDREKREGRMTTLSDEDRRELWQEAAIIADAEVRKHAWFSGDYTLAEVQNGIENVRHGLKRDLKLPDIEGDEDDEEDYEFEDVDAANGADGMDIDQKAGADTAPTAADAHASLAKAMPIDNVLRFMTKGV